MHRVAQASLRQRPGLVIRTTTTTHLTDRGLLAAIWSQVVLPDDGPVATLRSPRTTRMSLFAQANAGRSVPE